MKGCSLHGLLTYMYDHHALFLQSFSDPFQSRRDVVEELSAELSHEKAIPESTNPLDAFCEANPEADECRTYDD